MGHPAIEPVIGTIAVAGDCHLRPCLGAALPRSLSLVGVGGAR